MKKKENPGTVLVIAVLFAICIPFHVYLAVTRGNGLNMVAAVVFLVAAVVWFGRWRKAKWEDD